MADNQYQLRYWRLVTETRIHVFYLHRYAAGSEWWDKATNMFLALTSSASIAAWAIWRQFTFLWPLLIALSQVVTAVKPFLPHKQRLKVLVGLCNQLQMIAVAMEKDWFSVSEGHLSEEEIHRLTARYRAQSAEAEQTHFRDVIVPRNDSLLRKAERDAQDYYLRHYPVMESV
jgi:hypothetical protein